MLSPSGTTYHPINADFITQSFRIAGQVLVSHTGLLGLMSASNSSVLEIQDAQLARLCDPHHLVEQYPIARLVKRQVVAICANRRDELGALAMANLASATAYPVKIISGEYEISGQLEWVGRFDITSILSANTGEFIPLYHACISSVQLPDLHMESPVLVINRVFIDMIALSQPQGQPELKI